MPKVCLIVIDAQESFRHRPYSTERDIPAYLAAQNALIAGALTRGLPVVRVLHVDGRPTADNPFALESNHVVPLAGLLDFTPAAAFVKGLHNALVGTGLDVWLTENGIGRLIISGIRTEQCCETTTRHASDLGWRVDFVPDATLTWDICSSPMAAFCAQPTSRPAPRPFCRTGLHTVCTVAQALQRTTDAAAPSMRAGAAPVIAGIRKHRCAAISAPHPAGGHASGFAVGPQRHAGR